MDYLKYIAIAAISAVIALHIIALRANLLAASAIKTALREIDKLSSSRSSRLVSRSSDFDSNHSSARVCLTPFDSKPCVEEILTAGTPIDSNSEKQAFLNSDINLSSDKGSTGKISSKQIYKIPPSC